MKDRKYEELKKKPIMKDFTQALGLSNSKRGMRYTIPGTQTIKYAFSFFL